MPINVYCDKLWKVAITRLSFIPSRRRHTRLIISYALDDIGRKNSTFSRAWDRTREDSRESEISTSTCAYVPESEFVCFICQYEAHTRTYSRTLFLLLVIIPTYSSACVEVCVYRKRTIAGNRSHAHARLFYRSRVRAYAWLRVRINLRAARTYAHWQECIAYLITLICAFFGRILSIFDIRSDVKANPCYKRRIPPGRGRIMISSIKNLHFKCIKGILSFFEIKESSSFIIVAL